MKGMGNDLVREARRRTGLTREDLAAFAGTTVRAIAELEEGRDSPRFDDVIRYLRLMHLDLDLMLVDRDEQDWAQTLPLLSLTPGQRFERHERWVASVLRIRNAAGLAEPLQPLPTQDLLTALAASGAPFILIDGYASVLHGSPFMSLGLDLAVPSDSRIAVSLSETLAERTWCDRVHLCPDAFRECRRDAQKMELAGLTVGVASLADVIRMKQIANRPLDQRVLPTLREILASRNPRNRTEG